MRIKKDERLILQAATLYYLENRNQNEIAAHMHLSRQMVGRLLKMARDSGLVEIRIHYPATLFVDLERRLADTFHLKQAIVVPCENCRDDAALKIALGEGAAQFLLREMRDQTILGVSWGTTLAQVAGRLAPTGLKGIQVIQLNGGVARNTQATNAGALLQRFGEVFNAERYSLDAPAIVDNARIRQAISSDRGISRSLALAEKADVCIFSIGALTQTSVLVEAGYLSVEDVRRLQQAGAVGDICSRFFDRQGVIVDKELNRRTIGIDLDKLRDKRWSIAVAGGREKLHAIRGALAQRYCNALVVDEVIANELLEAGGDDGGA